MGMSLKNNVRDTYDFYSWAKINNQLFNPHICENMNP